MDILELAPPFDRRDVERARRRLARRWHPDQVKTTARKVDYEIQMKAVNAAADALIAAVLQAPDGQIHPGQVWPGHGTPTSSSRSEDGSGAPTPPVHVDAEAPSIRYARSRSYPEWGVGAVIAIRITDFAFGKVEWARVEFEIGARSLPGTDLEFLEFGAVTSAPGWMRRFAVVAEASEKKGDLARAAALFAHARRFTPADPRILRSLVMIHWRLGHIDRALMLAGDWVRAEAGPAPHRVLSHLYEEKRLIESAIASTQRVLESDLENSSEWMRLARLYDRAGMKAAAEGARDRADSLRTGDASLQ
jgi:tetratricopeptide (TPR) repeat protein